MQPDHTEILALLDRRMRDMERKIINSPEFQHLKARNAHMLFDHGSAEICACPEWGEHK
jgi:hypothetical protein